MKTDNTLSLLSKILACGNGVIIEKLSALGHGGISPSHGDILMSLYCYGDMSMQDIAVKIHKTASTVTTLVNKLSLMGYVESHKNEKDSRSIIISLTEHGRELYPAFMGISGELFQKLYAGFSPEEYQIFRLLLIKMYNQLQIK